MADLAEIYVKLRDQALTLAATDLALEGSAPDVFGVVMDMAMGNGLATIVSLADGTTSMYTSTGGGMIGGGEHAAVADATRAFIEVAAGLLDQLTATDDFSVPSAGTRFFVRTVDASLTGDLTDADVNSGQHALLPLYAAGQDVITQLRLLQEQQQS